VVWVVSGRCFGTLQRGDIGAADPAPPLGERRMESSVLQYLVTVDAVGVTVLITGQRRLCGGVETDVAGHLVQDGRSNQTVLNRARKQIRRCYPRQTALRRARVYCVPCYNTAARGPTNDFTQPTRQPRIADFAPVHNSKMRQQQQRQAKS